MDGPLRLLIFTRPWTVRLHLAVEEHWRRAGFAVEISYLSQHLESVHVLRQSGRASTFLPQAARALEPEDPVGFLDALERRYTGRLQPLMRYLMAERYFTRRSREWQVAELARTAAALEHVLDEVAPQAYLGPIPDSLPTWLARDLASARGIEAAGVDAGTIPHGRMIVSKSLNEVPGARERYAELRSRPLTEAEEAEGRALQELVAGHRTPLDYVPPPRGRRDFVRRLLDGSVLRRVAAFSAWQWRERMSGNWFVQPDQVLWHARLPLWRARARIADSTLLTDSVPAGSFLFFPLHFEPEATLLLHSSYFEDQETVLRNLARSLPASWTLVVKEHPAMRGQRELAFYRKLRRIPNVRLVPSTQGTNQLIRAAEAVAVIAGTVGLEASLMGRPVIMFGDTYWDYGPTIQKVGNLVDLPELVRRAPSMARSADEHDVLAFAASWSLSLPRANYYAHRGYDWLEPENLAAIADGIRQAIARPIS